MKKKHVLLILSVLNLSACASAYKSLSSGQTGCLEADLEISNVDQGLRTTTWVASCKGKKFICNSVSSSGMGSNQVTCKEAL